MTLFLLAGLDAMHPRPIWGTFIISLLFLFRFQLLYFLILFKNKKRNREITIP